jgi:hypothetical protein
MPRSIILSINKNENKTDHDRIMISKEYDGIKISTLDDVTEGVKSIRIPYTITVENHHDLLDYIEDCLDLLHADMDTTPHHSIDVMIPGRPVVCLNPKDNDTKFLLIRVVRTWCMSG